MITRFNIGFVALVFGFCTVLSTTSHGGPNGTLRAGFPMSSFNGTSATDAKLAIDAFLEEIAEGDDVDLTSAVFADDEEFLASIKAGEIDFFVMNADLYLRSMAEVKVSPVLASVRHTSPIETLLLVAPTGQPLSKLKGGSLLIHNSGRGQTPLRWISDHLLSSGNAESAKDYFESISNVNSPSRALLPVYFGQHDAAIISEGTFGYMCKLNPQIREKISVVQRSEPLLSSVFCIRGNYPAAGAERLLEIGTNLHTSERGRQLLSLMRTASLVPFREEYLLHNREIFNRTTPVDRTAKTSHRTGGRN